MIGLVLTGVFAPKFLGGAGCPFDYGWGAQIGCLALTAAISAVGTALILKLVDLTIGLRATPEDEETGLDHRHHGEATYNP